MAIKDHNKRPTRRRRVLLIIGMIVFLAATWQIVTDFFREAEKALRQTLRTTVKRQFPDEAAEVAKTFGIRRLDMAPQSDHRRSRSGPAVILIHGLDDPGKVWMNLAPALHEEGFDVLIMEYPNDQPVDESALFFFEELKRLELPSVDRIDIVAHSMGGLVSREMLTNPTIAYTENARSGVVPAVNRLIMVGTPNHGSELVRLRLLTEFRDQWFQALKGRGHWLRGILDGAGEAKIDLLPGSRFLETLNARPNPEGVNMYSIAGIVSPWNMADIDELIAAIRDTVPNLAEPFLEDLHQFLAAMTHGLGDGLVTVDSTRIKGVPHTTVAGTHLSMIRTIAETDTRIPPAVPVIITLLKEAPPPDEEQQRP